MITTSAIGHAQNVTLFEKLADKKFITPTDFGNYLNHIFNSTVEELEKSKAKLVSDVTKTLTANFNKQIQNLNQELITTKELNEKTKFEKQNLHLIEIDNLKKQIESISQLNEKVDIQNKSNQEAQAKILNDKIAALEQNFQQKDAMLTQANLLASQYQRQLKEMDNKPFTNYLIIIIAAIIGMFIGFILK